MGVQYVGHEKFYAMSHTVARRVGFCQGQGLGKKIQRKGMTVSLDLPMEPSALEPLAAVLLLLLNGE